MRFPLLITRTAFGSVIEDTFVFSKFFAFKIFPEATSFWKDQLHLKILPNGNVRLAGVTATKTARNKVKHSQGTVSS